MTTTNIKNLEARCRQRGYTIDEVAACIVSRDGDVVTVDVDHPAYPRARGPEPKPEPLGEGPGTELKRLLALVGITASEGCSCYRHAVEMNRQGVDWCAANVDTIVGWLREEAAKRRLPFVDGAGRLLVKRAIRAARRSAAA